MPAATKPSSRDTPLRPCLNCGDPAPGLYCPTCGQRKMEARVSTWSIVREALEDHLSLHAALPRTLATLFLLPGKLTEEYIRGRRARYIPPLRLYLAGSLIFFVVAAVTGRGPTASISTGPGAVRVSTQDEAPQPSDGPLIDLEVEPDDGAALAFFKRRLLRLNEMDPVEAQRLISERFMTYLSTGVFLLVPLFAFYLKILYAGSRRYFVEHFVFALHLHAAVFLLAAVAAPLRWLLDQGWVGRAMMVAVIVYTYLALARLHHQRMIVTAVKMAVLTLAYGLSLAIVALGVLVVSMMML